MTSNECPSRAINADCRVIGTTSSAAQVTPDLFTKSMAELAQEQGAEVTIATVDGLEFSEDGKAPSAILSTNEKGEPVKIEATDVVFTAGPWTASVAKKLLGENALAALEIVPRYLCIARVFISSPSSFYFQPVLHICDIQAQHSNHCALALYRIDHFRRRYHKPGGLPEKRWDPVHVRRSYGPSKAATTHRKSN